LVEQDSPQITGHLDFNELYLIQSDPLTNHLFFDAWLPKILPDDVVIIKHLYNSEQHKEQWEQIKKDQRVKLSIDLFSIGMLFYRNEFKEKQDFVLQ